MALTTMYAGKINSPATTLNGAINDIVTSITLTDASVLPDAPNIAVIGTGENCETILYSAKVGNSITGVTRGFQGTAISWSTGTAVARMFTAYDYDTLKTNITELDTTKADLGANSDITSLTGLTTPLGAAYGGTGVANAAGETITLTGGFALNLTLSAATGVTLPISGTLATLAGAETFTGKLGYNGLVVTANTGAITTGSWAASVIPANYGGTGIANNALSTLTISGNFATTLTVTNTTGVTLPTSGTLYGTATGSITSAQLLASMSDETGTGALVFGTSPTFTTQITTPKIVGNSTGLYLYDDGTNYVFLKDGGNVGFNISPDTNSKLHLATTNINNYLYIDTYDDGSQVSSVYIRKSDTDTIGTTSQTDNGDLLGYIFFDGVSSGNAFAHGAYIKAVQNGNAGTYVPTDVVFSTWSATAQNANQLTICATGNVGVATAVPTARLHLPAGTATASTAPLKFTAGTANTTAETGAMEYSSTQLTFVRTGTTREVIGTVLTKTDTGDPTGAEGLFCINTQDNTFKIYADSGWRQLATW